MDRLLQTALIRHLCGLVSARRLRRIEGALAVRTRYATVVLEDIFQPQNASAVLRTCEAMGVQDVHVIELSNCFAVCKNVVQGADKWLTLRRYGEPPCDNTARCLGALRAGGYRLAAMTLRRGGIALEELEADRPTAFCFGAEEGGLSETAHGLADVLVRIPMHGFTQSFNISVAAALCLHDFTRKVRASGAPWRLGEQEAIDLKLEWLKKSLPGGEGIAARFLEDQRA
jgi:tRNA (guanosine-2'-O-)-methyltransferase